MSPRAAAILAGLSLGAASCSARYATNANGLPVGAPAVTYYGPGAALGGTPVSPQANPPPNAFPPGAVPPPANLTAPAP